MDKRVESFLADKFQGADFEKIKEFMDRGFSLNGQIAIASVFAFAEEYGINVDDVLAACQTEWEKKWSLQHPGMRGDPEVSAANLMSLTDIYLKIGVPNPMRSV